MPLTYLSHQAPVIAIKQRWPQRWDGVALVTGSMAPDLAYAFNRGGAEINAHVWPAMLTVALPIALMAAWYVRWLAPTTFRQLPQAFGVDLRFFETLNSRGPGLLVTAWSAAVGVATHVFWDGLTHTTRWGAQLWPWLTEPIWGGYAPAKVFQYLSHAGGLLLALFLLSRIPAPEKWRPSIVRRGERVAFWTPVVTLSLIGFVWGLDDFFAALVIKTSIGTAVGLGIARVLMTRSAKALESV